MSKRVDQSRRPLDGDALGAAEWYETTLANARGHRPAAITATLTLKGEFTPAKVNRALQAVGTDATGHITVAVEHDELSNVTMYSSSGQTVMFKKEPTPISDAAANDA